jgi:hypothetical protein
MYQHPVGITSPALKVCKGCQHRTGTLGTTGTGLDSGVA